MSENTSVKQNCTIVECVPTVLADLVMEGLKQTFPTHETKKGDQPTEFVVVSLPASGYSSIKHIGVIPAPLRAQMGSFAAGVAYIKGMDLPIAEG